MSFITQGKTNWLFIIIFVVLAIAIVGGVLVYINQTNDELISLNNASEINKPEIIKINECSENFYYKQARSYKYELSADHVDVTGFIREPEGLYGEKTLSIFKGDKFYLPSGSEQSASIELKEIKDNKALFFLKYGASPPACETLDGCNYSCEFIIE